MDTNMELTINSFKPLFPDNIFPTFPWLLVKSLTFHWQLSDSLTIPSFPDKRSLCITPHTAVILSNKHKNLKLFQVMRQHPTYAVCPLNFRLSSNFIGVTSKSWTSGSSPPATNSRPSARKLPLYAFCRKWRNVFNVWTVWWSITSTYSQW